MMRKRELNSFSEMVCVHVFPGGSRFMMQPFAHYPKTSLKEYKGKFEAIPETIRRFLGGVVPVKNSVLGHGGDVFYRDDASLRRLTGMKNGSDAGEERSGSGDGTT